MNKSRRAFMKRFSGGVAGAVALPTLFDSTVNHSLVTIPHPATYDDRYWNAVRDQFSLNRERVYFNTGTIGPSSIPVQQAVKTASDDLDKRGEYGGGEVARSKLASFIHAEESEISLTHNTTEGINIVAWGLPLKRGDEVILTTHEHVGNALPWINRSVLEGISLKTFTPAPTADETLNRLNDLITPKTRVLALPHITCTIGQVMPVKEITALGHEKGLWVCIDGAQAPGMLPVDIQAIGCDSYAASCHKWMCSPRGTGFLYIKKDMLDTIQARFVGGYSDLGWDLTVEPFQFKGYVPTAHRYDYGTQSAPLNIGVGAAVDFLTAIGIEQVSAYGTTLAETLQTKLLELENAIEMLTPTEKRSRGSMIGFRLKTMENTKFGELASKNGFRIRLVPESHLNSIRVSTHIYNTIDEVEWFVDIVREAVKG